MTHWMWVLTMLIPAIGSLLSGLIMLLFYKLTDRDAGLMTKCVAGEISVADCETALQYKTKKKS